MVVIDQRRIGGNARSTVGTITDAWTYLRLVYSRLATPHVGESNHFSFNDPAGHVSDLLGLGEVVVSAVDRFLDLDRSLAEGAIRLPGFGHGGYWYSQYADIGTFDADTPLRDWTHAERDALLHGGEAAAARRKRLPKDYEGVVERFERIYLHTSDNLSERKQETIARFTRTQALPRVRRRPTQRGAPARPPSPGTPSVSCPHGGRPNSPSSSRDHRRAPRRAGRRRAGRRASMRWSPSGSGTSASTGRPPRCRAASRSASRP